MPSTQKTSNRPKVTQGTKCFWIALVLVWMILGGILVFGNKGLYKLYQLSQERDRLLEDNQTLKVENDRLCKTIDRLQNDQEMIEDIIRKELHYIKKNEIIYQLKPKGGIQPQARPGHAPKPAAAATINRSP